VKEFVQAYCATCKTTTSYTNHGLSTQCSCGDQLVPVFQVVLFLKDEQSLAVDEVFRLHYYSPVDNPSRLEPRLFNQDPVNLYQNEQAL
jgi:hypothetical protein